jgi:hypothetical protein
VTVSLCAHGPLRRKQTTALVQMPAPAPATQSGDKPKRYRPASRRHHVRLRWRFFILPAVCQTNPRAPDTPKPGRLPLPSGRQPAKRTVEQARCAPKGSQLGGNHELSRPDGGRGAVLDQSEDSSFTISDQRPEGSGAPPAGEAMGGEGGEEVVSSRGRTGHRREKNAVHHFLESLERELLSTFCHAPAAPLPARYPASAYDIPPSAQTPSAYPHRPRRRPSPTAWKCVNCGPHGPWS